MCASYGLGGGTGERLPYDLEPMSEQGPQELLNEWMRGQNGSAKITGKNARNLNPVIHALEGKRDLYLGWWWLWTSNGPAKFSAFNARDDNLLGRAWKRPFQQRAILPATWYVEKKVRFHLPNYETFGVAAITRTVQDPDGGELLTYAMVTRNAVGEAADTWHRMPLILPRALHDEWLDSGRPGDDSLVSEVQHASEEVSRAVRCQQSCRTSHTTS